MGTKEIFWHDPIGVDGLDKFKGESRVGWIGEPHIELEGGRVDTEDQRVAGSPGSG